MYDWRTAIQNMYKNLGIGLRPTQGTNFGAGNSGNPFYNSNVGQFSAPVSNYYGAPLPSTPEQPQGPGSSGGLLDVAGTPPTTAPAPMPAPVPQPVAQPAPMNMDYFQLNQNAGGISELVADGTIGGSAHPLSAFMGKRYSSEDEMRAALEGAGIKSGGGYGWFTQDDFNNRVPGHGYGPFRGGLISKQSFYS